MKYLLWLMGLCGGAVLVALFLLPEGIGNPQGQLPKMNRDTYEGRHIGKCNAMLRETTHCNIISYGKLMSDERQQIYLEGTCSLQNTSSATDNSRFIYTCEFENGDVKRLILSPVNSGKK